MWMKLSAVGISGFYGGVGGMTMEYMLLWWWRNDKNPLACSSLGISSTSSSRLHPLFAEQCLSTMSDDDFVRFDWNGDRYGYFEFTRRALEKFSMTTKEFDSQEHTFSHCWFFRSSQIKKERETPTHFNSSSATASECQLSTQKRRKKVLFYVEMTNYEDDARFGWHMGWEGNWKIYIINYHISISVSTRLAAKCLIKV